MSVQPMLSYLNDSRTLAETIDESRHWCPNSEQFTGCDALFSALQQGWEISGVVFCQQFQLSRWRLTQVYYFQLARDKMLTRMAVINSPHVERFITMSDLPVFYVNRTVRTPVPNVKPLVVEADETQEAAVVA